MPDEAATAVTHIFKRNKDRHNIFFQVNPNKRPQSKKAAKGNIAAMT